MDKLHPNRREHREVHHAEHHLGEDQDHEHRSHHLHVRQVTHGPDGGEEAKRGGHDGEGRMQHAQLDEQVRREESKSWASPWANEVTGNKVSPRAAMAPLMPRMMSEPSMAR